jgi:CRP/FNR family transcriptional regulator, anaerobic regulatory protein
LVNQFIHDFYKNSRISGETKIIIASHHHKVEIPRNKILLRKGEIIKEIYLIEHGIARSFVLNSDKEEITTHFFSPYEIIVDEISFLKKIPSESTYQAITDMIVWKMTLADFYHLFDTQPEFRVWVRDRITSALIKEKQTHLWMKTKSAHERYKDLILNNPEFNYHVPLKYIATYLGITDTSLSRIRREMIGKG